MEEIDIAGLKINPLKKTRLLETLKERILSGKKTWVTTPYSEFLYHALLNPKDINMLNQADFAVADGIGILWAAKYFSIPLKAKKYLLKIQESFWQALCTLPMILLAPNKIKNQIPEKIVGADLIWDLAKLASENNFSIFLLGGFDNTPELASQALKAKYQNLKISGYSNKNPNEHSVIEDIKKISPDILFVAYGPIKQERWIANNLQNLPVKLVIGLGGTFDYLAKTKALPPKFIRYGGLEWLWRLFTQPKRFKRIFNATFGLIYFSALRKVQDTLPYRQNVVSVIINNQNKIFLGNAFEREKQDHWQFPQGGLEKNETLEAGVMREIWEETNIKSVKLLFVSKFTNKYYWKIGFSKKFKGQEQKIVYLKFYGKDDEIALNGNGGTQQEFTGYKWVEQEELANTIHNYRSALIPIVLSDLKEMREKGIINIE